MTDDQHDNKTVSLNGQENVYVFVACNHFEADNWHSFVLLAIHADHRRTRGIFKKFKST